MNQDLSEHPYLQPLVSHAHVIAREYRENIVLANNQSAVWIKWQSDFEHGQDWDVTPLFVGLHGYPRSVQLPLFVLNAVLYKRYRKTRMMLDRMYPRVRYAGFSRLKAHQSLRPHRHKNPGHLIFHLGIDVSGDSGLKTEVPVGGGHVRTVIHNWCKAGDYILFDDDFTHSAWNNSSRDRVIFYVDFAAQTIR